MHLPPVELTQLSVAPLSVPTADPFVIASGAVHATRSILVNLTLHRLRDGQASVGLAEGACLPPVTREDQPDALAALERRGPALLGARFDSVDALTSLLDAHFAALPVVRSAVEVGVLDALAQLEGAPLHAWLSGRPGPAPALETDITIPILAPDRMATLAAAWLAQGFRSLKIKIGRDLDTDLRALQAMVRAAPSARFRPDANAGLSVPDALRFVAEARRLGATLECFEQPCATLHELAQVAETIDVPVLADESVKTLSDLHQVIRLEAADGVNLKIVKSGSLLRALEIGKAAQAHGLSLMVGGMVETRLGMTAATHLAAALGGVAFADLDTAWLLTADPFEGGYASTGPVLQVPSAPGLGVRRR